MVQNGDNCSTTFEFITHYVHLDSFRLIIGLDYFVLNIKLRVKRTHKTTHGDKMAETDDNTRMHMDAHIHTRMQLQFPGSWGVSPSPWCHREVCLLAKWMGFLSVLFTCDPPVLVCVCVCVCAYVLVSECRHNDAVTMVGNYLQEYVNVNFFFFFFTITHLQLLIRLFLSANPRGVRITVQGSII